jgi:Domain of unknown function (DUF4401)
VSVAQRAETWERLRTAGLVDGDAPAGTRVATPWFVRAALGIAGWIGAVFLFGFIAATMDSALEKPAVAATVGAVTCGIAALFLREAHDNEFVGQFGLAASLAGQVLLAWAIWQWADERTTPTACGLIALELLLLVGVPSAVHRVWSALAAGLVVAWHLHSSGLPALAPIVLLALVLAVWLAEFDRPRTAALARAAGYGLALAAACMVVVQATSWWPALAAHRAPRPLFPLALTIARATVLIAATLWLLRRERVAPGSRGGIAALVATVLLALVSSRAPGVGPSVAILVVGFANGNRVLAGLGIVTLLAYLSGYYYALDRTLLEKSALLAGTGIVLLAARLGLVRWWPATPEVARA